MDIKAFIKSANDEYVKMKSDMEKEREMLASSLEKAQETLNGERERFKKEEEELLNILDATKKERIGEIERVAIEKMDILKAEKEKIIKEEASRRQNVENAYKDRFDGLEREHAERLEDKRKRYEKRKSLAKREYEELRAELESSSLVHSDMGAMLAGQQNRELLEKIEEIEDKNIELRASIHEALENYSNELIEYLKLGDFNFEYPSKEELLKRIRAYYESLDGLKLLQANLKKTDGCDAIVDYNKARLDEAKKELEGSLHEIDEWYATELEAENRNYISEKNILEKQMNNSSIDKPEIAERVSQIDKELEEIEQNLVIESGKIMEDLSRSEGAKTRMFNMVKAEELKRNEELLQKARERLDEFVKGQDKRLDELLARVKRELQTLIGSDRDFSVGQIRDGKARICLPKAIAIGGYGATIEECELLERLYGKGALNLPATISIDVEGGEPLILTSDNEEYLDRVMGGITLKFIEEFPKDSLGVKIVSNPREVFEAIARGIVDDNDTISREPMQMLAYADAEENRITGKLTRDIKNAYELYEAEKGQVITLLVIRDGIDQILDSGEMSAILRKLLSERGRNAGIRLLIACNDSERLKPFLENGVVVSIKGENAFYQDERVDICSIPSKDVDFFISGAFSDIASLYSGDIPLASLCPEKNEEAPRVKIRASKLDLSKRCSLGKGITYEDLGFDGEIEEAGEEIDLPVGMTEYGIGSISLDCSLEGSQSTGCLVLGATSTGKSSLLHSLVVEGCKKYAPSDLELWLLDFKRDGAVSRYKNDDIPHIKVIKQGADQSDIYYVLNSLCKEIEERLEQFEKTGIGLREKKFENLHEYNQFVKSHTGYGVSLPRIVLVVDEMQELFKNGDSSLVFDIMTKLARVTVKGRATGVHTVIISNGPCNSALRDAYVNHIKCKVSFRMSKGDVLESCLGDDFDKRAEEIEKLCPGEMYISLENKLIKAKTPYVGSGNLDAYIEKIRKAHSTEWDYCPPVKSPECKNGRTELVIGRDYYTDKYYYLPLDKDNSSLVVLTKDEYMQSQVLTSALIDASERVGARALCCNGASIFEVLFHSTLKERSGLSVRAYEKTDFTELVKDAYDELVSRRNDKQREKSPLLVIINGLSRLSLDEGKITSINNSKNEKDASINDIFSMLGQNTKRVGFMVKGTQDQSISVYEALQELITEGGPFGIYFIASIDNASNYKALISKCHSVAVSPDMRNELQDCGLDRLKEMLSVARKEECLLLTNSNGVDKIKPIIFG